MTTERQLESLARIHELLEHNEIEYWLFGGWAVDFHVGSVTREHDDLDLAVWHADLDRIAELLVAEGWEHAPEKGEDGYTGYERGGVRVELAFIERGEEGDVYTPLREGRGEWPEGAFGEDVLELEGVRARVIGLRAVQADKSGDRVDPLAAEKDAADIETLSFLLRRNVPSRIRVRRGPRKGRYDRGAIEAVLDRGLLAHVSFVDGDEPVCIPMLYARVGDRIYIHGSTASRAIRLLAGGAPACLTVTIVDGLVLARSAFEHSANYDSVMAFGSFVPVEDESERLRGFEAFTEKLLPGRWEEVRPPNAKELKATRILAMEIREASVKRRTGPPDDDDSPDAERETWAGVVPIVSSYGQPEASPGLKDGIEVSPSVRRLLTLRAPPG
jgi:nitroimidazol reductase NimA-like FMN-containing flavoprotein (pyridoxamine 5'-phosphate oxidase superfamily)